MDKLKTVKVVVFVDGAEYASATQDVPDWAVGYVAMAACVQVEDPDLEAASEDSGDEEDEIPVCEGTIIGVAPQARYTS